MSTTKLKRIAVSSTVYRQLKSLGYAGDSFNDVLVRILEKNQMLESDSRVGTREKTLTTSLTPLFNGDDKP
jgi:predicted CopG family antitoxin